MARAAGPARGTCARCLVPLAHARYEFHSDEGSVTSRCLRCALTTGALARRSLIIGLIVGTILTAINQGNLILGGGFPAELAWKIPLTYAVPYCVATTGALLNARRTAREKDR